MHVDGGEGVLRAKESAEADVAAIANTSATGASLATRRVAGSPTTWRQDSRGSQDGGPIPAFASASV
jgi:hypothetical protein